MVGKEIRRKMGVGKRYVELTKMLQEGIDRKS